MADVKIRFDPPDLIQRMNQYPNELDRRMREGVEKSLLVFQENVPGYPAAPVGSTYVRTGTLGGSLGSGQSGGKLGAPSINTIKGGSGRYEGAMGTDLIYAQWVIGDETQAAHMSHWWRMKTVLERSLTKLATLWGKVAGEMVNYLEGRG